MEIDEIRLRLGAIEGTLSRWGLDMEESLVNLDRSPSATCIQVGVVVEQMLRDLWRRLKLKGPADRRQFEDLLTLTSRKLEDDGEAMPVGILTHLRDIQLRRNQAAHHWNVDRRNAENVLGNLADVMTWYFGEFLPAREGGSGPEGKTPKIDLLHENPSPASEAMIPPGNPVAVQPPDPSLSLPRLSNPDEAKTEPNRRTETVSVPPKPQPTVLVEPPKQIINSIGMKLVLIPSGEFAMGSPDSDNEARSNEKPQHRVWITRPFYLGATVVTQGQYRSVTGESPSKYTWSDDLPVGEVYWNDAIRFCDKLTALEKGQLGGARYRLPTEAEWEYACRAGSTTRYSFGDNAARLGEFAWYSDNSGDTIHAVGEKRPNAFNLYDMHGNVWEWCQDWYDKDYYGQSPGADPPGPLQGAIRVRRGGCWFFNPPSARSADRYNFSSPGLRDSFVGFRVARVQSGR